MARTRPIRNWPLHHREGREWPHRGAHTLEQQKHPLAECTDARDALIIALAPKLLAALEDMVALAIKMGNLAGGTDTSADLARLRKAQNLITKARDQ